MEPLQSFESQLFRDFTASPKKLIFWGAFGCASLAAFVVLDSLLPQSAWWFFVGLSLTSGFLHGALDVVLLKREYPSPRRRGWAALLYLAAVVILGAVLAQSWAFALFVLIAMSVWHFGEPYGRWGAHNVLLRAVVGGASVMLPVLLSPSAMPQIIRLLTQNDAAHVDADLLWIIWRVFAFAWVALLPAALAWLTMHKFKNAVALLTEIAAVVVLNLLLSPLMAFALYFGAYHSLTHISRVNAAQKNSNLRQMLPITVLVASGVTGCLLGLLWWYLQGTNMHMGLGQQYDSASVLRWLVVALAAVTLPHLVLVSRCADWLKTPA